MSARKKEIIANITHMIDVLERAKDLEEQGKHEEAKKLLKEANPKVFDELPTTRELI
jgi:hypothetical protein